MPIKSNFNIDQLAQAMEEEIQRQKTVLFRNLAVIGEKCNNRARTRGSYKDQTGNLRSSIGYVIVSDGQIVDIKGFEPAPRGTDRRTGQQTGEDYARRLASQYPTGVALIVVAGMSYAIHVSSKGYDVLESAELLADELTEKLLKQK